MALIGKIRSQLGWLMIVLVFTGVAGFLLMDVSSGRYGMGEGVPQNIGVVNGEPIKTKSFYDLVDMYGENQPVRAELQNSVWDLLVNQALIEREARQIGIDVTADEMGELFLGADQDISYTVRSYFGRQTGGQIDRTQLKSLIELFSGELDLSQYPQEQHENIRKQQKDFLNLQSQVRWERISGKYTTLIRKSIYAPKWMIERSYPRQKREFDINYVLIPYTAVNAEVSDAELEEYIKNNPKKFQRKASADIEFITFKNYASAEDSAKYRKDLDALVADFTKTNGNEELIDFVNRYNGTVDTITYFKKDELTREPQDVVDTLFKVEKGTVYGPYMHNGSYRLIKLMDRKTLPDSVDCEHIMLSGIQTQDDYNNGLRRLDSLKNLIKDGKARFDSLAMQYSFDDQTKMQGGKALIGRGSRYGKNLEDNVMFVIQVDSMSIVASQVGQTINLHLVRVKGYRMGKDQGVRIALFNRPIVPSENTTRTNREKANAFLAANRNLEAFKKAAQAAGMNPATAYSLPEFGFEIIGLGKSNTAAEIIRWAHFEAKPGEVAGRLFGVENAEQNFTEQLVLPVLVNKFPAGMASIKDPNVKNEVDRIVRGKKRTQAVNNAIKGKSLQDVAAQYSTEVKTATLNYGVPLLGEARTQEHKVAAIADLLEPNATSPAINGKQGIYVISVTKKSDTPVLDAMVAGNVVARRYTDVIMNRLAEAMLDNASLQDNRSKVITN